MSNSITANNTANELPGRDFLALLGRILVAAMFIPAGFAKLTGFAGTVGYIASVGLPLPAVGAVIAIVVELGVGIAFLLGYKTRLAALILAVFTLAASIFFHAFWAAPEAAKMVTTLLFTKNIAIVGGLLALAAFGPGRFSIDKK
ncbi:DoxX family protein [Variovorax sp. J22R133]|uniref:DoxX family protein n=1 Tax=Variovorax brevis TaxID=3053503 RepID=UPI0025779A33|nr:DoxX family protein [Variovorax sp. J22R133]MDM0112697.1 DoxX family protein [Variovorax sp. J22R133]